MNVTTIKVKKINLSVRIIFWVEKSHLPCSAYNPCDISVLSNSCKLVLRLVFFLYSFTFFFCSSLFLFASFFPLLYLGLDNTFNRFILNVKRAVSFLVNKSIYAILLYKGKPLREIVETIIDARNNFFSVNINIST